jgi:hypothetical protein
MAWPRNGERPSRRTTGGLLRRISPALCRAGETSEVGEARVTAKAKGAAGTNEHKEPLRSTVMRGCAEGTGWLPGHLCHSDLVAKVHRVLAPHHLRRA